MTGRSLGALLAAAVVLGGCREPTAAVEGSVTFDGQPLHTGAIQFMPTDGDYRKAASATVSDGRYVIASLATGEKVVSVRGVRNESGGPEPLPLPDNLEGDRATVVLGPGRHTIDITLNTP